jgi:hypothetical protein
MLEATQASTPSLRSGQAPRSALERWRENALVGSGVRWHEFIGREHAPHLKRAVETLVVSGIEHETAVRILRNARPRGQARSFEACEYWGDWKHRVLLLYALLTRRGTVSQFAREIGLTHESKLYVFLREWHIDFRCFTPPPKVSAVGDYRTLTGTLHAVGEGYELQADGRRLPVRYTRWREWRIIGDPGPDVTLEHALRAAAASTRAPAWSRGELGTFTANLDRESRTLTGHGIVPHPHLPDRHLVPERAVRELFGEAALEHALRHLNRCQCQFWNDRNLTCGLASVPEPKPCDDHLPLED